MPFYALERLPAARRLARLVEQEEDTFGGRHRRLEHVVALRQIEHGLEQHPHVLQERDERAERQPAAERAQPAVPQDERDGERTQEAHERPEDGERHDLAEVGVVLGLVDLEEAVVRRLLLHEHLDDADARDRLLDVGVQPGDLPANLAECGANAVPELPRAEDDDREQRKYDESQPPVEAQHHDDDAENEESVAEQAYEHRGEELVDRGDVVRRARDEASDRSPIEERDREAEDVREDLAAHVVHDALARVLEQVDLDDAEQEPHDEREREEERQAQDARQSAAAQGLGVARGERFESRLRREVPARDAGEDRGNLRCSRGTVIGVGDEERALVLDGVGGLPRSERLGIDRRRAYDVAAASEADRLARPRSLRERDDGVGKAHVRIDRGL